METVVNSSATEKSMQEVTDSIEAKLFGTSAGEPIATDDDEVTDDANELPDSDDSDSEESDGSEEVVDDQDYEKSLADYLGVDEDRIIVNDDGVFLNAIIDGETKQVPLKELAMSYQLQGHVNNKSMALENERKEFEASRNEMLQIFQQKIEGLSGLSKVIERELVAEYDRIDWDRLRVENPAEWTALRTEYAQKAQEIQRVQQLIHEENLRVQAERAQIQEQMMQQHIYNEYQKVIAMNPEWADQTKLAEAQVGMRDFLKSTYAFTDDDMKHVTDHRLIKLILDAKAYREGIKGVDEKREKQVPKFSKPGLAKGNAQSLEKARSVKAKRAAVKKTGHVNDVANLLLDRM